MLGLQETPEDDILGVVANQERAKHCKISKPGLSHLGPCWTEVICLSAACPRIGCTLSGGKKTLCKASAKVIQKHLAYSVKLPDHTKKQNQDKKFAMKTDYS